MAVFAQFNTKRDTIIKFQNYFKNLKNPHRKLKYVIERYKAKSPENVLNNSREPPYGLVIDTLLKEKVVSFMRLNNNIIDDIKIRVFLVELLTLHNKTYLLHENAGSYKFGHQWACRFLRRWRITNRTSPSIKMVVDNRVEMTNAAYRAMITDTSRIIRRKADDLLPCVGRRLQLNGKKTRYEDEDEETSWVNTLLGGYEEYERLTLDDRLMLPCSVRSK